MSDHSGGAHVHFAPRRISATALNEQRNSLTRLERATLPATLKTRLQRRMAGYMRFVRYCLKRTRTKLQIVSCCSCDQIILEIKGNHTFYDQNFQCKRLLYRVVSCRLLGEHPHHWARPSNSSRLQCSSCLLAWLGVLTHMARVQPRSRLRSSA